LTVIESPAVQIVAVARCVVGDRVDPGVAAQEIGATVRPPLPAR
jgi:hypothetical protein